MKNIFKVRGFDSKTSFAILVLRVVMGVAFMLHGWPKIQNPMGWMGDAMPGFLQLLAAVSEFGGGLALVLGLLIPLSCFGILCTMAVAVHMHMIVQGGPFVGKEGSYELPLLYLVLSLAFILMGPGRFSADSKIFGTKI